MSYFQFSQALKRKLDTFYKTSTIFIAATLLLLGLAKNSQALEIAIFNNGTYVDTALDLNGESYNLQFAVEDLGHSYHLFVGTDLTSFQEALDSQDVLIIPDLEVAPLDVEIDNDTRDFIRSFVSAGNRLIVFGDQNANVALLLNSILSLDTLTGDSLSEGISLNLQSGTDGSVYDGLDSSILSLAATYSLSGLPVSARVIYGTNQDVGSVVEFPYGNGKAIYLGYDWYDSYAAPDCSDCQNSGWEAVLERVLAQAELKVSFDSIPEAKINVGEQFDVIVKIENSGISPAYQNQLSFQVPSPISILEKPENCQGISNVICEFDAIGPGESETFTFTFNAKSIGDYNLIVTTSSKTFEKNLGDNTASLALSNLEAGSGGCSLSTKANSSYLILAMLAFSLFAWKRKRC